MDDLKRLLAYLRPTPPDFPVTIVCVGIPGNEQVVTTVGTLRRLVAIEAAASRVRDALDRSDVYVDRVLVRDVNDRADELDAAHIALCEAVDRG